MLSRQSDPYWVDRLTDKHEGGSYDATQATTIEVKHHGRVLKLILPNDLPPVGIHVTAEAGNLLFLVAEQMDETQTLVMEGDITREGVVMVARQCEGQDNTYWVFVWHQLYREAIRRLSGG